MQKPTQKPKQSNQSSQSEQPKHQTSQSSQQDTPISLFTVYLKGMAMGMADIVPGVSGGTIALITGVYNRLITAISSVDVQLFKIWKSKGLLKGFVDVWKHLDATFVLCLFLGIGTSILTLAGFITRMLDVLFILGVSMAVTISSMPMLQTGTPSLPYLFFAGAIAICAMILPGVSGSFILLLLGAYQAVLDAVHGRDFVTIGVVMMGMVTGLLLFSKFLKWLLSTHYQATLVVLTGFIAGSLVKIYPWKVEVDGVVNNVMPSAYPTGANWGSSLFLMLIGAGIVFVLSWWGRRHHSEHK